MNLWAGKSLGHDGIRKKKQGEVVGNGVPSWRLCRWNQGLASAPSKGHPVDTRAGPVGGAVVPQLSSHQVQLKLSSWRTTREGRLFRL